MVLYSITDKILEIFMYKISLMFFFSIMLLGCANNSEPRPKITQNIISTDALSAFKEFNYVVSKGKPK